MFLEFISRNWIVLLALVGVAAVVIYLTITRQWLKVREFAYQAMLLAERTFGDQDGRIKFDFVVRIVYKYFPSWLKRFITEEQLRHLIQEWYDLAKDFLDDGLINSSV
ncbi:MAG TPA: hypothetical protein GXZ22_02320 [Clostridiaceae bacterium]|jgi:hypothetical protein|nr:hypothetical protein [Clostridiaceae bacterium]